MKITINDITYEVIKNEKDAIDEDVLKEQITELQNEDIDITYKRGLEDWQGHLKLL